jgi:hypothetical protein
MNDKDDTQVPGIIPQPLPNREEIIAALRRPDPGHTHRAFVLSQARVLGIDPIEWALHRYPRLVAYLACDTDADLNPWSAAEVIVDYIEGRTETWTQYLRFWFKIDGSNEK